MKIENNVLVQVTNDDIKDDTIVLPDSVKTKVCSINQVRMVKSSMCDWCNNEKYDDTFYGNSDFDKDFEIAEGSWTSLYMLHNSKTNKYGMCASGEGEAVVNINFCPNCGGKL